MLIGDYARLIKRQYVAKKLRPMIDDIVVYTNKGIVYKVVVRFCELQIKQLKKLGVDYHIIILNDFPKINITDELVRNCKKYDILTFRFDCNFLKYMFYLELSEIITNISEFI